MTNIDLNGAQISKVKLDKKSVWTNLSNTFCMHTNVSMFAAP